MQTLLIIGSEYTRISSVCSRAVTERDYPLKHKKKTPGRKQKALDINNIVRESIQDHTMQAVLWYDKRIGVL